MRPLIASALLLIVTACSTAPGRDAGAYNACALRHAQGPLVCEAPLQAYRVDASDLPAKAAVPPTSAGEDTNRGRL